MKCAICGIDVNSIDQAIEQGWIPFFFEGDDEHGPICHSCSEKLVCIGEDGEFELKQEYSGKVIYHDEIYFEHEDGDFYGGEMVLGFILN